MNCSFKTKLKKISMRPWNGDKHSKNTSLCASYGKEGERPIENVWEGREKWK